jgi:hypothetical protein
MTTEQLAAHAPDLLLADLANPAPLLEYAERLALLPAPGAS